MTQVVAETRWTEAVADTAMAKQRTASGHLVWKPWPNIILSRLPKQVSKKTKRMLPRNPPTIVMGCEETSSGFIICIPLKVRMDRTKDTIHEAPTANAIANAIYELSVGS